MRAAFFAVALTTFALALAATATGSPSEPSQTPGCAKASLNLVTEGQLSLATDNPAFEPWWGGGSKSKAWELNDRALARATSRPSRTGSRGGSASRRRR
jgi:hypothetical protein